MPDAAFEAVTERRRAERRTLANRPFLALFIGALPEDRRKRDRRVRDLGGPAPASVGAASPINLAGTCRNRTDQSPCDDLTSFEDWASHQTRTLP